MVIVKIGLREKKLPRGRPPRDQESWIAMGGEIWRRVEVEKSIGMSLEGSLERAIESFQNGDPDAAGHVVPLPEPSGTDSLYRCANDYAETFPVPRLTRGPKRRLSASEITDAHLRFSRDPKGTK